MATSKKYNRRRSCKKCGSKGGSKRKQDGKSRANKKNKKSHKWHQKGCQSGGGSMTGGWPWSPSDVHHVGGGSEAGEQAVPHSMNGNHYSLNTTTLAPPQNSNHLVERGQYGGKHTKKARVHRRKYIGEQHGGMAEYLPESVNSTLRGILETPSSISNALQGASTAFVTSNPTVQPIAQPVQLK